MKMYLLSHCRLENSLLFITKHHLQDCSETRGSRISHGKLNQASKRRLNLWLNSTACLIKVISLYLRRCTQQGSELSPCGVVIGFVVDIIPKFQNRTATCHLFISIYGLSHQE